MNLNALRQILWIHAVEENDRDGDLAPLEARETATYRAASQLKRSEEAFFSERAAQLMTKVEESPPAPLNPKLIAVGVLILAIVLGLASNQLGTGRHINILAVPLLGMLLWNLVLYLLNIIRGFSKSPPIELNWLLALFPKQKSEKSPFALVSTAFARNWAAATSAMTLASLRSTLHFAAAGFAVAMVAGMYVQGLAYEYRAVWQSTFLDANAVQNLVNAILGPAASLIGRQVPDVTTMQWKGNPDDGQGAAIWIHLYGLTIALFIVIPRLILGGVFLLRCRAERAAICVKEIAPAYFERLLAEARGDAISVKVVPHSFAPDETLHQAIRDVLSDQVGGPVSVDWAEPIAFGEEGEFVDALDEMPRNLTLLFNFSTTPEEEVHADLVKALTAKLDGNPTQLRVLLDASAFDAKRKSLADFRERRQTREQAWRRMLEPSVVKDHVLVISAVAP
ncbi:MAG: DUF2868 domain-containing protein [Verrucomicrobiota bacterium]